MTSFLPEFPPLSFLFFFFHLHTSIPHYSPALCMLCSVHVWMDKWNIHIKPSDIKESSLAGDMRSLCDNTRMAAIAATVIVAENQFGHNAAAMHLQPSTSGSSVPVTSQRDEVEGLRRLLKDPVLHVRVPAAIALFCIGENNQAVSCSHILCV